MSSQMWELIGTSGRGVVVALKRDGRPQLSNVDYLADADAQLIRFSTTDGRAKVHNLRRDPRASFYVSAPNGGAYVVAEATAELTAPAAAQNDATVEELVDVYRRIRGEHPDWQEYREVMVADGRLVVRLHVQRLYGYGLS
jgi:PPOX class probable F420-dependent enzyme